MWENRVPLSTHALSSEDVHGRWPWCFFLVQIVRALEGDMSLEDLNEGVRPGQSALFDEAGSPG
jgi:hypothetical protein